MRGAPLRPRPRRSRVAPRGSRKYTVGVTTSVLTLLGVTKRFGDRVAVDAVDLDVSPGVCFGLLGPNGAGKTTTLRMVYGVTRPSAGEVRVFGVDVARDPRAVRARLGVTLQENALIEPLSPEDNLRIFGRYHLLAEPELGHWGCHPLNLFTNPVRSLSWQLPELQRVPGKSFLFSSQNGGLYNPGE